VSTTGVAINRDEYVPTTIPTNIAKINPLIDPPKINIINNTKIIVNDVDRTPAAH
jgi:hypothetical protein